MASNADKVKWMSPPLLPNRRRQWAWVIGIFFLVGAACGGLIWNEQRAEAGKARVRASELAHDQAQSLQRAIERSLSATYALAALVRRGQGKVPDFEPIATEMLPFYPGVAALGLSPGGIITQVVPLLGNEPLMGYNQLGNVAQAGESSTARDSGQLTLIGPLHLVQGGTGVVGLLPIHVNDNHGNVQFWGFFFCHAALSASVGGRPFSADP